MTVSLKKEMQEMQEWITQAEEDYLESDFHYKTPEKLCTAVEELKVCLFLTESLAFQCSFSKDSFVVYSNNVKGGSKTFVSGTINLCHCLNSAFIGIIFFNSTLILYTHSDASQ